MLLQSLGGNTRGDVIQESADVLHSDAMPQSDANFIILHPLELGGVLPKLAERLLQILATQAVAIELLGGVIEIACANAQGIGVAPHSSPHQSMACLQGRIAEPFGQIAQRVLHLECVYEVRSELLHVLQHALPIRINRHANVLGMATARAHRFTSSSKHLEKAVSRATMQIESRHSRGREEEGLAALTLGSRV